jgi:hypothetical protein
MCHERKLKVIAAKTRGPELKTVMQQIIQFRSEHSSEASTVEEVELRAHKIRT